MKKTQRYAHTGRRPNESRRQAVAAMYQGGMSLRAIADMVGVSAQAVQSMLVRMGVARRPPGGNTGGHSRHRK